MVRTKKSNKEELNETIESQGNNQNGKSGKSLYSKANGLTVRQNAFVREYLADKNLNATKAAIRAGYSERTAGVVGCQTLKLPKIKEAIAKEMELRAERTKVDPDKVIKELAKLAFSNMKSFVEWGPDTVCLRDSEELTEEDAACVSEVVQTETAAGKTIRFKLHDKKGALIDLGKHLGLFPNTGTIKHVGDSGGPVEHKFDFGEGPIKAAFDQLYGVKEKKPV